jgi:glycosyltransferase involved in cell wall biosynthesis
MKIGYFIRNYVLKDSYGTPTISGGGKVVSQHVKLLNEMGYETLLLTKNMEVESDLTDLNLYEKPTLIRGEDDIPDCDIYIGTMYKDVKWLFKMRKEKIIHLCQGYEPIDYLARVEREAITEKYLRKGLVTAWRHIDALKFKRRVKLIESIYALPTIKAAVSRHLAELIQRRYHQKCFLIQNGIDPNIFYPNEENIWCKNGKIKILSVGAIQVGSKGIPDVLQSARILKEKGVPLEFTRVSPYPPSEREGVGKLVDYYYMNLKEKEMAELYRDTDLFISSSLEGEGFGLPAMEALACGVPSILTEISSYRNFDGRRDFAYFVPTHRPDRIAEGVLAFIEDKSLRERCRGRGINVSKGFILERTKQDLKSFIEELRK